MKTFGPHKRPHVVHRPPPHSRVVARIKRKREISLPPPIYRTGAGTGPKPSRTAGGGARPRPERGRERGRALKKKVGRGERERGAMRQVSSLFLPAFFFFAPPISVPIWVVWSPPPPPCQPLPSSPVRLGLGRAHGGPRLTGAPAFARPVARATEPEASHCGRAPGASAPEVEGRVGAFGPGRKGRKRGGGAVVEPPARPPPPAPPARPKGPGPPGSADPTATGNPAHRTAHGHRAGRGSRAHPCRR